MSTSEVKMRRIQQLSDSLKTATDSAHKRVLRERIRELTVDLGKETLQTKQDSLHKRSPKKYPKLKITNESKNKS